jgi:hypothetical protein
MMSFSFGQLFVFKRLSNVSFDRAVEGGRVWYFDQLH